MANQLMVDVDRISDLPDHVLSHILSFLSTKEAVSTSILSTRWKYLFLSVPNLDLDDSFFLLPNSNTHTAIIEFMNFVDRMLFFQTTTNLDKLCLNITQDTSCLYSWISVAVTLRHVRQLHLCISNFHSSFKLPDVLFTSKTLIVLKLKIDSVFYVPDEVCLPSLKTLHLENLFSDNASIERLISGCIMLENLVLDFFLWPKISQFTICHPFLKRLTMQFGYEGMCNTWIVIDAPSLVYLKYSAADISAGYSLLNMHSLVEANIDLLIGEGAIQTDASYLVDAVGLFSGIVNVQSLDLSSSALKVLCLYKPLPLFKKLVKLKIYHYRDDYAKGVAEITESMPNLEKLDLIRQITW